LAELIDRNGAINEDFVVIEEKEKLYVFGPNHPRPSHVVGPGTTDLSWNW